MSKEVVVYKNSLNKISLGMLTPKEQDIFFSMLYKVKNKNDNTVVFDFSELQELIDEKRNKGRIMENLKELALKLSRMSQNIELPDGTFIIFNLFNRFKIDPNQNTMEIKINEDFKFLLNEVMNDFTKFELQSLVSMKSGYSKTAFRLMKQFQSTGWYEVEAEEFRFLLGVPDSYETTNFNKRVLEPIMKELKVHFPGLKLQKIRKGREIKKLRFTWNIETVEVIKKPKIEKPMDDLEKKLQKRLFEKIEKEREQERSGKIWL